VLEARAGEIAAVGTAILWTLTYVQFTAAVRRLGPSVLNRLRLLVALVFLVGAHLVVFRTPLPFGAEPVQWGWLVLSGIIGFAASDAFLFRAFFHIGAHRSSLLMSLVPLTSALLAWAVFGERLTWVQVVAGLVTISGIACVVSARRTENRVARDRGTLLGILFALGAVVAQSSRYILSLQGMRGGLPPLSANLLQILAATVTVWAISFVRGTAKSSFAPLRDPVCATTMTGGALTGPFLGVTLSMVALTRAPVGVASTLMALVPVFLLPISRFVFKEAITLRAVVGTLLAVAGVAVLFLT